MSRLYLVSTSMILLVACVGRVAYAQDAQVLTKDELMQLMPGAKVDITFDSGGTNTWTNNADGTLHAVGQSGLASGGKNYSSYAPGTWHISDDGKFCSHIEWRKSVSDWCRSVAKAEDGAYVLVSSSGGPSWKLKVSK
ncbi:DUF995 domain-containing protein [Paraburkholderia sp.]|uniref:DUF995 domain-containing protein n=1 Tax=Paraburkholderia sp. TaxID=1926495 RepID=UPI0025CBA6E7|nr:DUF995 domain-containing protein [Paraburkholderia sp.]